MWRFMASVKNASCDEKWFSILSTDGRRYEYLIPAKKKSGWPCWILSTVTEFRAFRNVLCYVYMYVGTG